MKIKKILLSMMLSLSMASTALAGAWTTDSNGWVYQNDDGSRYYDSWQWIDGDADGVSECYYFNSNGNCLTSTTTPDGYTVNANGAWTVNGVVQTRGEQHSTQSTSNASTSANHTHQATASQANTATVWLSATGSKYHRINNCGRMNPSRATQVTLEEAIARGIEPCSKCY